MGFLLADIFACDWQGCPTSQSLATSGQLSGGRSSADAIAQRMESPATHRNWTGVLGDIPKSLDQSHPDMGPDHSDWRMCYTIYLYHFAIISALGRFLSSHWNTEEYALSMLMHTATIAPLIWVICAVLYMGLEKPFMGWSASSWGRQGRSTCTNSMSAKIA